MSTISGFSRRKFDFSVADASTLLPIGDSVGGHLNLFLDNFGLHEVSIKITEHRYIIALFINKFVVGAPKNAIFTEWHKFTNNPCLLHTFIFDSALNSKNLLFKFTFH